MKKLWLCLVFISLQRIFSVVQIPFFNGIDRDLKICYQLSLWSSGLAPIPKSPELLWTCSVPCAQYKPWHAHKRPASDVHTSKPLSSTEEEGAAGMTALSWRLQHSSALQHRQIRHIQQQRVLRMMSSTSSLRVCCVWSSRFVFSITLHCLFSPMEKLDKMPAFSHAGYLTTFICCRVNCNTGIHVIKAAFDSPLCSQLAKTSATSQPELAKRENLPFYFFFAKGRYTPCLFRTKIPLVQFGRKLLCCDDIPPRAKTSIISA